MTAASERVLHVVNGDAARMGLQQSGVPGTFVVWPDVLYEGPTPLATGEEWIQARSNYLASTVARTDPDVLERYRRNDAALEAFRQYNAVVFWLEHDLFDQLLLIRHLWWLGERIGQAGPGRSGPRAPRATPTLSLVCRDLYLGPLRPEAFVPLFAARQPITAGEIATGSKLWRAFCAPDPRPLHRVATATPSTDYTEFPYLRAALVRHLEEFPSSANGLSRTESQMLRVLENGPLSFGAAFRASTNLEEAYFMGDSSFWNLAGTLASARHPLITIDAPAASAHSRPNATLALTDAGRDVLAGRSDHVVLNGIDRWLGGVHLTPESCYRWTGSGLVRA